jgi:molecular chaperone GrpE
MSTDETTKDAPETEPAPEEAATPEAADAEAVEAADEQEAEVVEIDPSAARIAQLEEELAAAQARLRAVSKAYTDQKAEMSAFRERVEGRAKAAEERQAFSVVKGFFDPVQNLKRSLEAGVGTDNEGFLAGLRIVVGQFDSALDKLGLSPVPGVGAPFDPNLHEALALAPVEDPEQDGKILMVHLDGFMVNGKVLQAAQVVIGKHTPEAPEAAEA